jgi:hypothetical protein
MWEIRFFEKLGDAGLIQESSGKGEHPEYRIQPARGNEELCDAKAHFPAQGFNGCRRIGAWIPGPDMKAKGLGA